MAGKATVPWWWAGKNPGSPVAGWETIEGARDLTEGNAKAVALAALKTEVGVQFRPGALIVVMQLNADGQPGLPYLFQVRRCVVGEVDVDHGPLAEPA